MDTFDNRGGEVGLEIEWKGAQVSFQAVPKDDPGDGEFLRKDQFVDASLDVAPNGDVTFEDDSHILTTTLASFSGLQANTLISPPASVALATDIGLTT